MGGVIPWVVAVVMALAGIIVGHNLNADAVRWADEHRVLEAKVGTGPCGDLQLAVIDENRVAVAGRIVPPSEVSNFKFRNEEGEERTYYGDKVVMVRKQRR